MMITRIGPTYFEPPRINPRAQCKKELFTLFTNHPGFARRLKRAIAQNQFSPFILWSNVRKQGCVYGLLWRFLHRRALPMDIDRYRINPCRVSGVTILEAKIYGLDITAEDLTRWSSEYLNGLLEVSHG